MHINLDIDVQERRQTLRRESPARHFRSHPSSGNRVLGTDTLPTIVDTQQVQDGGVEIVNLNDIFDGIIAENPSNLIN
jgi:hypothetical protein